MEKSDLTKKYKAYYSAKINEPEIIDFGPAQYLSIAGKGDPNEKLFSEKIQALYATAYAVKFNCKADGKDFVVAKLEGLWSFDLQRYKDVTMEEAPLKIPRSEWTYRLLIRLPDFVQSEVVNAGIKTVVEKKQIALAADIELYKMNEGKTVQILHVGPFATEPATLKLLQQCMQTNNFQQNGLHHEIYLSDFRTTAPEKLKTILREPVKMSK